MYCMNLFDLVRLSCLPSSLCCVGETYFSETPRPLLASGFLDLRAKLRLGNCAAGCMLKFKSLRFPSGGLQPVLANPAM